jgi:Ca2+-binding EF-hand superfamily protein
MRRFAQFLTTAALAALASAGASAQNANAVTRAEQTANAEARFKRLDGDGNGRFDRAEFIKVRDQAERAAEARLKQVLSGEFAQLDSNKDQGISAAEIDAKVKIPDAGKKTIARLDKNKDGKISMAEYTAQSGIEAAVDPDLMIRQWDANGDKTVTREEFTATVLARFDSLDANKDGTVTAQEAAAKMNTSAPAQGR